MLEWGVNSQRMQVAPAERFPLQTPIVNYVGNKAFKKLKNGGKSVSMPVLGHSFKAVIWNSELFAASLSHSSKEILMRKYWASEARGNDFQRAVISFIKRLFFFPTFYWSCADVTVANLMNNLFWQNGHTSTFKNSSPKKKSVTSRYQPMIEGRQHF